MRHLSATQALTRVRVALPRVLVQKIPTFCIYFNWFKYLQIETKSK